MTSPSSNGAEARSNVRRLVPAGDEALVIEFDAVVSRAVNAEVRAFDRALRLAGWREVRAVVPSYHSLLVYYDSTKVGFHDLAARIRQIDAAAGRAGERNRRWRLPVCYGLDCEADIADLAASLNLSCEDIVAAHANVEYSVYLLGFSPGFAYLGELPQNLQIPRKSVPSARVPANAVQLAGQQTAVSSMPMPSGWYVVGRTPAAMFDAARDRPFLLEGGDLVTFEPIDRAEFDRLASAGTLPPWEWTTS